MKQLHYKNEILSVIQKFLPHAKVYLFGSRARGTHKEGSDVDLALDTGTKIDISTILDIKDAIYETTMPVFVDIVDMHSIPDVLKEEIVKEGILWTL